MKPRTQYARSGDVHVAYQVVGEGIEFSDRGEQELKGVPGESRLFSVAAL